MRRIVYETHRDALPVLGSIVCGARRQMALLCVDSRRDDAVRLLRVRPAVLAVNETGRRLPVAALASPEPGPGTAPLPEAPGDALLPSPAPQPLLWWRLAAGIPPDPAAAPEQLQLLLDLSGCRQPPLPLTQQRGSCVVHGRSRAAGCANR